MAEQRVFHAPGVDLAHLGETLSQWFQTREFETQVLPGGDSAVTVQARTRRDWRSYVGASAAFSVMANRQGDNLVVQVGAAKWSDKVVGGVAALILFWPLAAFPAWGAFKQKQMIDDTLDFVQQYVASDGEVSVPGMSPFASSPKAAAPASPAAPVQEPEAACPSCGQPVKPGAKFCESCGARLSLTCAQCGAEVRAGAKFCEQCGTKVESGPAGT